MQLRFPIALLLSVSLLALQGCAQTAIREPTSSDGDAPNAIRTLRPDQRFSTLDSQSVARRVRALRAGQPVNILALSGGGADGAFGAGALVGLTRSALRPQFSVVTGVSTGALIAPYAFLGPDWDNQLVEVYTSGRAEHYARVFLTSLLRQLHRVKHDDIGELYSLISTTPVDDLRDLLADTPAGPYLAQDNGRFFSAVRAVANTHLSALEHIARQCSRDSLSVRSWIRNGKGTLFLPYKANEIATLRSIISTWMRLAIYEAMSQPEGDQRLWFAIDELDALGAIDGLKDALARLRKFGGRCVLGLQSIAQVSGTYGRAEAQTIVENCGNTLILRCSSSEGGGTARFASGLIGEREVLGEQVTKSRGGGVIFASNHRSVSTSTHHVTESAVLASEIEQLADLSGFLKFASQPEWKRVRLAAPT